MDIEGNKRVVSLIKKYQQGIKIIYIIGAGAAGAAAGAAFFLAFV